MLSLFKKHYIPLNTIEISKDNLLFNYQYLTQTKRVQIAPVLKSNAYGHGLVQVAKVLDDAHAPFFCVDSIHEGYQLYKAKIKTPILIMGYVEPENLSVKKLPFFYAVYSNEMLEGVKKYQSQAGIHIFVDTGMHREGVRLEDLSDFVKKAKECRLKIEGLMSHFAMADKPKKQETIQQVKNFVEAQKLLNSLHIFPKYIHMPASLGILHMKQHPSKLFNMGRVGLALYGIDSKNTSLKPVLSLISTIVQVKELKKGEKVGYDFTFTAKRNMKIGILPIGYNDGVNRRLSNKGCVKIGDTYCSIIGRISMNITVIDVTNCSVHVGDRVVVYSSNPKDRNSISSVAKACEMIPYEILVQLHVSTKRLVV